jgi:hypothetical protein
VDSIPAGADRPYRDRMTDAMQVREWSAGSWTTQPAAVVEEGPDLLVTAVEGSDAWRHTSYAFVHDDAHALLAPPRWRGRGDVRRRLLVRVAPFPVGAQPPGPGRRRRPAQLIRKTRICSASVA